jgi:hypothetical protein
VRRFVILAALLATACTNSASLMGQYSSAFSQAVPVCELLAEPGKYLAREVDVSGLYANSPHQRILYDPSCEPRELALQISPTDEELRADQMMQKKLDSAAGKGVKSVYQGLLESEPIIANCSEINCRRYTLTNSRLLTAEAAQ